MTLTMSPTRTCQFPADECGHWHTHDEKCNRLAAAHNVMCDRHCHLELVTWYQEHHHEDCCPDHCDGTAQHVDDQGDPVEVTR